MNPASRELNDNLARVRDRIERAAARAGRRAEEITLIAVSKTHSSRRIEAMYETGLRHFGENRVQERESKLAATANLGITWHMIGHLQRNKAARAAELFDSIDSVDSMALAEKLDRAMADLATNDKTKNRLRVLVEVKLDPEPAKSGVSEDHVPRLAAAILGLPNLDLRGLMGVPPYFDNPEEVRPYFGRLRGLRDAIRADLGHAAVPVLSMGMSHDFEIAVEEGATEIRIGTALFGEREYK